MTAPVCPECKAGKHRNCNGSFDDDEHVDCPCDLALHDPAEVARIQKENEFLDALHEGKPLGEVLTEAAQDLRDRHKLDPRSTEEILEDAGVPMPVVMHPETGEAQSLTEWVNQPTRQEQEAAETRSSVTQLLAFELWNSLGCDQMLFQDYVDRNGLDETWAALCNAVQRACGVEECGNRVEDGPDGEPQFCVLLEHSPEHPCYGPDDVGRSEPVPWKDLRS